jgi:hypothetical protein
LAGYVQKLLAVTLGIASELDIVGNPHLCASELYRVRDFAGLVGIGVSDVFRRDELLTTFLLDAVNPPAMDLPDRSSPPEAVNQNHTQHTKPKHTKHEH